MGVVMVMGGERNLAKNGNERLGRFSSPCPCRDASPGTKANALNREFCRGGEVRE